MKNINLKGVTKEAVTGIVMLLVALVNAILQMVGFNTLPIENTEVSAIVSGIFLVVVSMWNTWKNRNISKPSQISQQITDALKQGEITYSDVLALISKIKK